jgi:peptidoglycan-N-acetylglucosamine deacetylase
MIEPRYTNQSPSPDSPCIIMTMLAGTLISSAAGILAAAGGLSYAVRGRSARIFAPSVHHGNRSRRSIALTFDDGPSEATPALLEILAEHSVPATFFMCGQNVRRHPQIARQVAAAGHEIGNHTDSHPRLDFRSPEFIFGELALAQETIRQVTGRTPALFRAPYGVRWLGLRSAQSRLALTGVMWTVIGHDWEWPARRVSRLLLRRASNGAIMCLHDGRGIDRTPDIRPTLDAVAYVIPILKERGFAFETVSRLL